MSSQKIIPEGKTISKPSVWGYGLNRFYFWNLVYKKTEALRIRKEDANKDGFAKPDFKLNSQKEEQDLDCFFETFRVNQTITLSHETCDTLGFNGCKIVLEGLFLNYDLSKVLGRARANTIQVQNIDYVWILKRPNGGDHAFVTIEILWNEDVTNKDVANKDVANKDVVNKKDKTRHLPFKRYRIQEVKHDDLFYFYPFYELDLEHSTRIQIRVPPGLKKNEITILTNYSSKKDGLENDQLRVVPYCPPDLYAHFLLSKRQKKMKAVLIKQK